ncbi:MAG: DUF4349 domain-containing protein [Clostridia bacterium]|nr:DUF4349 domain-containing protein [Clostridia bacterium]
MKHLRPLRISAMLIALLILCTSCQAAADSMTSNNTYADFGYAADADDMLKVEAEYVMSAGSSTSPSVPSDAMDSENQTSSERKIIKTMRINAETKAFDRATAAIEALCAELGGYVESSSRSGGSIRYSSSVVARSASYVLRIPAEKLDAFRSGMGSDINVVSESTGIEDITDQYFDVDTRLATLKTQEERLLAMLETADELEYLLTLEERLAEVRYQIESYTGTLRRYDSQVAYSTVRLSLDEVIEYTQVIEAPQTFSERVGIAFRESWADFADNCKDFAVGFIYALPTLLVLAVIVAVPVTVIVVLVRRGSKKSAARNNTNNQS